MPTMAAMPNCGALSRRVKPMSSCSSTMANAPEQMPLKYAAVSA